MAAETHVLKDHSSRPWRINLVVATEFHRRRDIVPAGGIEQRVGRIGNRRGEQRRVGSLLHRQRQVIDFPVFDNDALRCRFHTYRPRRDFVLSREKRHGAKGTTAGKHHVLDTLVDIFQINLRPLERLASRNGAGNGR